MLHSLSAAAATAAAPAPANNLLSEIRNRPAVDVIR